MFNNWMKRLELHLKAVAGDRDFIQFTLDEQGFELPDDTPMSSDYFDAPWARDPERFPESLMQKYHSSWIHVYHPDLIERARPSGIPASGA